MPNSVTIVIRNLTTGAGTAGLTVKLRSHVDNFATDYVTLTAVGGKDGVYEVNNLPFRRYKLWVNGTEDDTFGGDNGRWLPEGDEVIRLDSGGTFWDAGSKELKNLSNPTAATSGLNRQTGDGRYAMLDGSNDPGLWVKKAGDGMSGQLDMNSQKITELANATAGTDALNRDTADSRYLKLAGGTMAGDVNMDIYYISVPTPNADGKAANKKYVDDKVALIPIQQYQESPNVLRLVPNGTQEDNKVYTSYSISQNVARGYASTTRLVTIEIKGSGTGGRSIQVSNGAISGNSDFNSYVSIKGENQLIELLLNDASITVIQNSVVLENLKISRNDSGQGTPVLNGFIFKDCYLQFDVASVQFVNCEFRGTCYVKVTNGTCTFTTCKGGIVITNKQLPGSVRGWDEVNVNDF